MYLKTLTVLSCLFIRGCGSLWGSGLMLGPLFTQARCGLKGNESYWRADVSHEQTAVHVGVFLGCTAYTQSKVVPCCIFALKAAVAPA